jgi:hypothetical protein
MVAEQILECCEEEEPKIDKAFLSPRLQERKPSSPTRLRAS